MNNWDALSPKELNDFRSLLRAWLDLRICSANALAVRAGCSSMTVYHIRNGRGNTTNKTVNEIMQAMGIMERKYIAQWQQQRRKAK